MKLGEKQFSVANLLLLVTAVAAVLALMRFVGVFDFLMLRKEDEARFLIDELLLLLSGLICCSSPLLFPIVLWLAHREGRKKEERLGIRGRPAPPAQSPPD